MEMASCSGRNDLLCPADTDLNNLMSLTFLFVTCTAANTLAFLYERTDSDESDGIDTTTSTDPGDKGIAISETTGIIERDQISKSEEVSSNKSTDVIDSDSTIAVPNGWYRVISNAIQKRDTLTIILFVLVSGIYILITGVLLLFAFRYATGPYESNPFSWMTSYIQELSGMFHGIYGPLVFLMANKKSRYPFR